MKKILSKLKPLNPLPSDLGEIKRYGFNGDIAAGSDWITDWYSIFLRAGFDEGLLVNEITYTGKRPTPDKIFSLWSDASVREDIPVHVLGSLDRKYSEIEVDQFGEEIAPTEKAILRDELDRIIYADSFKLAFMLYALKPDELSVARDGGNEKWISFRRRGELVGCLMPMRRTLASLRGRIEDGYDVDGEPISLEIILDAEVAK